MSLLEDLVKTWEKKYWQRHYGYRDFHRVASLVLPGGEAQALGAALAALAAGQTSTATLYVFGTNAMAKLNLATMQAYGAVNWPAACFARRIRVNCDQNAWVSILSINPEYQRQKVREAFKIPEPVTASQLIFEAEQRLNQNDYLELFPTLGYAIVFRADTVQGNLNVQIEGNVEGSD